MTIETFDLAGPLPEGTVVLEASAGTGKTHTIAALAARYVAEAATPIEDLMVVTFGREATAELRERTRERLVAASKALRDPAASRESSDAVESHLASCDDDELVRRRERLSRAVANFDAATITTTHGFCYQMLAGLGIAADLDTDVAFTEDTSDIVVEATGDLYVRAYGQDGRPQPPFDFRTAAAVARDAVGDLSARLEPVDAVADSEADVRRRLATGVRAEVARRKRARRVMDFDDLLVHLRAALTDADTGADALARIRSRYSVVLVDEFQDTDPVQWDILRTAFHGHCTLVLIGDPKQAIYAFRGADVATYLRAVESAGRQATLGTNWRSDAPLVSALQTFLHEVALGDPRIVVHDVGAENATRRIAHAGAPLRLRVIGRDGLPLTRSGLITVAGVRRRLADDIAADIVGLLSSDATVGADGESRPVEPRDVAVLVKRNEDGRTVRDALHAAGVPVVLTGTSNVFASDAAREWLTLLAALEQPHRAGLGRAAALTSFIGWSADLLAAASEHELDGLSAQIRDWSDVLGRRGVAALFERASAGGLAERVLSRVYGERDLTDLRHVAQALHAAATSGQLGVAALMGWLQRRVADSDVEGAEETSRRLESDAEAVQIITIHRSKGLEFPVVYAPYLWDRSVPQHPDPLRYHDAAGRVLDVGGPSDPGYDDRRALHLSEEAGESLRLAYVALTRASSQVVTWWAPTQNAERSPLHRLLFAERGLAGELGDRAAIGSDDGPLHDRLGALSAESGGLIAVETADAPARIWSPRAATSRALGIRSFDRDLDLQWTRTSYSGLTAGLHDPVPSFGPALTEAEEPGTVDEPSIEVVGEPSPTVPPGAALPSPMADLPRGAAFGTLVHAMLERADFTAPDAVAELAAHAEALGAERVAAVPAAQLGAALAPALATPLGPLADGRALAEFVRGDRLDELDFELPLLGGDDPTGAADVGQIASLLRHGLPDDDPLRDYVDDLDAPLVAARTMRGFLGGSIDAVLRVRASDGGPRYVVVDYKTNWLGGDDRLTSAHYRPDAMATAMREAHYPLQALLYSAALHRFLRWRQPDYDPDVHLGGVLYLFLRGMCGPDTPTVDETPCGVFSWRPPPSLVVSLSDLLDRGEP
jgi:exodeoxyribonuclease V beta subunit